MPPTLSFSHLLFVDAVVGRLKKLATQPRAEQSDAQALRCLVIGLGESGLAILNYLKQGSPDVVTLFAFDTRSNPPSQSQLQQDPHINYVQTTIIDQLSCADFDVVLMSPGLSIELGEVASWLKRGSVGGLVVLGEMDLFGITLDVLRDQTGYAPKLIGVTGSNGKTTVVTMTHHVLGALGFSAVAAGNISPAAMAALSQALVLGMLPQVWVLELSSFQLSLCQHLRLDAGVLLNVSEDHLDWHVSMQTYRQAKEIIYRCARVAVMNADDPYYLPEQLACHAELSFLNEKNPLYFGLSAPKSGQQWGLTQTTRADSVRFLARHLDDKNRCNSFENILATDALRIRGLHNVSNALAVLALCEAIDVLCLGQNNRAVVLVEAAQALTSYRGQAHRVEWVRQVAGVDFFDDSKGTNVGATQAALMGLAGDGFALFVILGGDGKGQDFAPLAVDLSERAKAVFLIGRDAQLIARAIEQNRHNQDLAVSITNELTFALEQAFEAAIEFKQRNPAQQVAVLLSPACASLDQFKNYAHRAQVFCEGVNALSALTLTKAQKIGDTR